jgi:hypothetical protein
MPLPLPGRRPPSAMRRAFELWFAMVSGLQITSPPFSATILSPHAGRMLEVEMTVRSAGSAFPLLPGADIMTTEQNTQNKYRPQSGELPQTDGLIISMAIRRPGQAPALARALVSSRASNVGDWRAHGSTLCGLANPPQVRRLWTPPRLSFVSVHQPESSLAGWWLQKGWWVRTPRSGSTLLSAECSQVRMRTRMSPRRRRLSSAAAAAPPPPAKPAEACLAVSSPRD